MKRFNVIVTRTDEYTIEIDESKFGEDWKKDFESAFWPIDGLQDIAENLAGQQARFGSVSFIEGYGHVRRDGTLPFSSEDFDNKGNWLPEEKRRKPAEGLNIIIVDEDNDISFDVTEL